MNKKQRKQAIIGVSIAVVVLIGLAVVFWNAITQSALVGGTVLSVSQVNLLSNDPELSGKAYLVNVVVNGGGESIKGTITPEQLQSFGIKDIPAGDFTLQLELLNYTCDYGLNSDAKTFYKLEYQSTGSGCLAQNPPYADVDINSLKAACKAGVAYDINMIAANKLIQGQAPAGGNCDMMIHLNKLAGWMPEETNPATGDVICYLHDCNAQRGSDPIICGPGLACYDQYRSSLDSWAQQASTRASYGGTTCCVQHTQGPAGSGAGRGECVALDGGVQGDWVVTEIGGVPFYQGYKIDTATELNYIVRITIKSPSGQQVVGVITPQQTSANLNNVAIAKFVGNLLNNKFCPVPAVDNAVVKDVVTGKMKVVKRSDYDPYVTELENLVRLDIDHYVFTYRAAAGKVTRIDPAVGGDVIFEQMSNLNNRLTNIFQTANQLPDCTITADGTKLQCKAAVAPTFPELQLKIRADWLGIYTPVGLPVIQTVTAPVSMLENTFSNTQVTVKNTGASDSFDMFYQCAGGSAQVPVRQSIDKDVTVTVDVPLFATYGQQSCLLTVQSVNDKTKKSTYQLGILVQQSAVISDVLDQQTQLKQQYLDDINRLWVSYQNATTYEQQIIREQINEQALKMQGLLDEQKASTAQYQKNLDDQIAALTAALNTADASQRAAIQQQIDGLKTQQTQINTIVASNADLNKQLQTQIDKGLSQQKQIDILAGQLQTINWIIWAVGIVVVLVLVGGFFYWRGRKSSRRGRR